MYLLGKTRVVTTTIHSILCPSFSIIFLVTLLLSSVTEETINYIKLFDTSKFTEDKWKCLRISVCLE